MPKGKSNVGSAAPENGLRDATELNGTVGNVASGRRALRCFRDREGTLRAGLYGSEAPQPDDDWEHGEPLTDATDAAVARRTAGTECEMGTLLGIAYERLRADPAARGWLRVPKRLEEWDVRIAGTGTGDDRGTTIEVLATSRRSAVAVAILVLADKAAQNAHAARRARPSGPPDERSAGGSTPATE